MMEFGCADETAAGSLMPVIARATPVPGLSRVAQRRVRVKIVFAMAYLAVEIRWGCQSGA
jgi:hypothetical protein